MSVFKGRQIGGKGWNVAPATGAPPSQVGVITPGTPTATTIPITFAPATGSTPILNSAYTSPHGASTWTFRAFVAGTGDLITGLAPSTDYDIQVVPSNTYGSGLPTYYLAGVTTAAAPPIMLSANRYDLVLDKSSGPVGTTGTATIYPNAIWAGDGSKAITLSGTGVSFPSGASVVIPSSGTTPLTVAYTITATGDLSIAGTNTGGLYNPYPAPFNAFASSSGTAQTLTAAIVSSKTSGFSNDQQVFQRDTPSGNPTGWATTFGKGWGEIWVTINPGGASAGLFAKLIDADSAGATATLGTGTYLQSTAVQVYGALSAGSQTIRLQHPAAAKFFYLELATDSAFTNPVRLAQRFGVGTVVGFAGPSQQAGLVRAYAYSNHEATTNTYGRTVTNITGGAPYLGFSPMPDWYRHNNADAGSGSGEGTSAGAQEFGRLLESQLGVVTGLCGVAAVGVGAESFVAQDGSIASGSLLTIWPNVIGNKFRYMWFNLANGFSTGYDMPAALRNNAAYMPAHYPACAVIGYNWGGTGVYGSDGSRVSPTPSYTRCQQSVISLSASNPMVASLDDYHWNRYYTGHSSMSSRVQFARTGFRALMDSEILAFGGNQTTNRGPVFATGATMAAGSRVIRIPYKHHGGTALSAVAVNNPDNSSTGTYSYDTSVSAADLATIFTVWDAPGYYTSAQSSRGAIRLSGAVINTASPPAGYDGTVDITLYGASGVTYRDNSTGSLPSALTVQFASDFGYSGWGDAVTSNDCGRCAVLVDDQVDSGNGIPFGKHIKPLNDIAVAFV